VNLKGANLEEANFEGSDHYKVQQLRYFEKDKDGISLSLESISKQAIIIPIRGRRVHLDLS
jgi:hypothetical protein